MRLDSWWPWIASPALDAASGLDDQIKRGFQLGQTLAYAQQATDQDWGECAEGGGSIRTAVCRFWRVGRALVCAGQSRVQVVSQQLGREVLL